MKEAGGSGVALSCMGIPGCGLMWQCVLVAPMDQNSGVLLVYRKAVHGDSRIAPFHLVAEGFLVFQGRCP
jgi:hypothetical protein